MIMHPEMCLNSWSAMQHSAVPREGTWHRSGTNTTTLIEPYTQEAQAQHPADLADVAPSSSKCL